MYDRFTEILKGPMAQLMTNHLATMGLKTPDNGHFFPESLTSGYARLFSLPPAYSLIAAVGLWEDENVTHGMIGLLRPTGAGQLEPVVSLRYNSSLSVTRIYHAREVEAAEGLVGQDPYIIQAILLLVNLNTHSEELREKIKSASMNLLQEMLRKNKG